MSEFDIRCKGVHIKLDKETHTNFKVKLIHHGLSMQEAFEWFAKQVGGGSASANAILERFVHSKIAAELKSVGLKEPRRRKPRYISDLSDEKLYDLINQEDPDALVQEGK